MAAGDAYALVEVGWRPGLRTGSARNCFPFPMRAGKVMIPLLASVNPEALRGPLSGMNALLCSSEEQLHQALEEIRFLAPQGVCH